MAELNNTKSKQPRVDLTPMVDLGFLLITFFIFTTALTKPTAMRLAMPDDRNVKDSSLAPAEKTMNIIIGANGELWTYCGKNITAAKPSHLGVAGIRSEIIEMKKKLVSRFGTDTSMVVLIKPTAKSTYENLVDCLDEMSINSIGRYMILEPEAQELQLFNIY